MSDRHLFDQLLTFEHRTNIMESLIEYFPLTR